MSTQALRIGILGAARVATYALIAPAATEPRVRLAAVAAREGERAREYAQKHGIERVVADYDALVRDPEVDAIYNALPPSRHADLTIAALRAGKHVLCEKPFAMNAHEARSMIVAARESGRVLMEAFHYRYHPFFAAVLRHVRGGELGQLVSLAATFTVNVPESRGELRFELELGGGALMDLGTYCVHWCRSVAGAEPTVVGAERVAAKSGVDMHTRADLEFPGGLRATIDCGFDTDFRAHLRIVGSKGTLEAHNPLVPHAGHKLVITTSAGETTETVDRRTTYACQLDAFYEAVLAGAPVITGGDDSIAQMVALDSIAAAGRQGVRSSSTDRG